LLLLFFLIEVLPNRVVHFIAFIWVILGDEGPLERLEVIDLNVFVDVRVELILEDIHHALLGEGLHCDAVGLVGDEVVLHHLDPVHILLHQRPELV